MGIDLSNAWKGAERIANTTLSLLPNLLLACVIFGLFLLVASGAKSLVRRIARREEKRQSLAILLGQLTYATVTILGLLIALSVLALGREI